LSVPLGNKGISSPIYLHLPVRGSFTQQEGWGTSIYVGSGAGISYKSSGLVTREDLFSAYLGQDLDTAVSGRGGTEYTSRLQMAYSLPTHLWDLIATGNLNAYYRQSLSSGPLEGIRSYPDQAPIDFGRGSQVRPMVGYAVTGVFVKKPLGPVTPFLGATCSV